MAVAFPNKLKGKPLIPSKSADFLKEKLNQAVGLFFVCIGISLVMILFSYDPTDPSFRSATSTLPENIFGSFGSYLADPLHLAIGTTSYGIAFVFCVWGWRFIFRKSSQSFTKKIMFFPLTTAVLSMFLAAHPTPTNWSFAYGLGGIFGDNAFSLILGIDLFEINKWLKITTALLAVLSCALIFHTLGITMKEFKKIARFLLTSSWTPFYHVISYFLARKNYRLNIPNLRKAKKPSVQSNNSNSGIIGERLKSKIDEVIITRKNQLNEIDTIQYHEELSVPSLGGVTKSIKVLQSERSSHIKSKRNSIFGRVHKQEIKKLTKSSAALREEQPSLQFEIAKQTYTTPALSLLESATTVLRNNLSDDALNENARMLENVLDDYGVKGEIVAVRPGPVVTLYELEPAAGLKASRVIGLSDDIARSMSALSARVSTIPGRSVIGIELPNFDREKVLLREILSSRAYGDSKYQLPLALGKDIGGETIVTNLARMPHLLIAGTTGSGKSVGINTMILSLLYSLTPDQCRLIMIDPKMLELSVYDGIPHLLSPVVTDPKKAVVALKWAVSEMEERYRKMSKMGVRNIDGFNARVEDALTKGEDFNRTVQTGFNEETGNPILETEYFTPE